MMTFLLVVDLNTHAESARPPSINFVKKLTSSSAWVALTTVPYTLRQKFIDLGCTCTHYTPWLRLCWRKILPLFLPRCMECRHGLAMRILCVRLSVCLSVARVNNDKNESKICPDFYILGKII